jgi:2-keto-4-pentenoate hydratase/2-oxohepta-3-ene-1,7-dioic acid hydratase in catechol pathway
MARVRFLDEAGRIRTGEMSGSDVRFGDRTYEAASVEILPPVEPTKVVATGRNYREHIEEGDPDAAPPEIPRLFFKTPNTVVGHDTTITIPEGKTVEPEVELGVVVGTECRDVAAADAMDVVDGFTCLNDLSNRDDQFGTERTGRRDYVRGKAFDNSCPLGPAVVPPEEVPDDATLRARVNGETVQRASRDAMIFTIPEIIESITQYITLEPGDVIATGTCEGPVPVSDGDRVTIEIEGIGTLENTIREP